MSKIIFTLLSAILIHPYAFGEQIHYNFSCEIPDGLLEGNNRVVKSLTGSLSESSFGSNEELNLEIQFVEADQGLESELVTLPKVERQKSKATKEFQFTRYQGLRPYSIDLLDFGGIASYLILPPIQFLERFLDRKIRMKAFVVWKFLVEAGNETTETDSLDRGIDFYCDWVVRLKNQQK